MKNKKGFTLVELLAVILILGVLFAFAIPAVSRWIDRGKVESLESQKKTLVMASQSYALDNSSALPKVIGETTTIKASDLKNAHYLKDDIKNGDKKSCMNDSYVKVYKRSKTEYTYTAFIYCDGDSVPEDDNLPKLDIDIIFTDDNDSSDFTKNVSITKLKIIINEVNGIDGYSYILSVKYQGETNYVEIYNSGSLNGGGRETLTLEKSLREYVDVTKASDFSITVKAYNRLGGYSEVSKAAIYDDDKGPDCGTITGEAEEDEWDKNRRSRTISITCSDGNGSGCIKDTFTKTFDTEMKDGIIEIKDNAGNTTNCSVRVHLDWTRPTLTVTAYKRNSDGSKGNQIGQVTADNTHNNQTLNAYTGSTNGWLNGNDFPYGLVYVVSTTDNVILNQGVWSENTKGLWGDNSSIDTLIVKSSKILNGTEKTIEYDLIDEGIRKAKFVLKDKANNTVTVNITAQIDRTKPTCSTSKKDLYKESGVTVSVTCKDKGSKCSSSNVLSYSNQKTPTSYSVNDIAGNTGSCEVDIFIQKQHRTRYWIDCARMVDQCVPGYSHRHYQGSFAWSNCSSTCSGACNCTDRGGENNSITQSCICTYYNECASKKKVCEGAWSAWSGWSNVGSCSKSNTNDCRNLYY